MKDLLRIADLSPNDLEQLLEISEQVCADLIRHAELLDGDTVITYFAKPSTRTRLSFGSAISHLGGIPEVVGPNELQLGRGETIEDTARVSRYAHAFVIRTYSDDARFSRRGIDPGDQHAHRRPPPLPGARRPADPQAALRLARGLRLAYLGDGNNVAHSLLEACALAGVDITVATPLASSPTPMWSRRPSGSPRSPVRWS